jgi:hypothetical protein
MGALKDLSKIAATFAKLASIRKVIPKDTVLYHGAPNQFVPAIEEGGTLRSTWNKQDFSGKRGGGDLTEEGLIWVTPDMDLALGYAKGNKDDVPGKIFAIKAPKDFALIHLSEKLDAQEAEALAKINKRQHYAPIEAGMTIDDALTNINVWGDSDLALKDILPLIHADGILNHKKQFAIMADELSISDFFNMDDLWPEYEERKARENQEKEEEYRREQEMRERHEEEMQQKMKALTPEEIETIDEIADLF